MRSRPVSSRFFLGRAIRTSDGRPTGGIVSPHSFLLRKVFLFSYRYRRSPTSGRRPMLPSRILKSPTRPTSIRTLSGASAPVPAGCPQLERVLPSRTRTECLCFQRRRSWRVSQSPELGDLLLILSSCFLPFLPWIVIPQWLVHFTAFPEAMKQYP